MAEAPAPPLSRRAFVASTIGVAASTLVAAQNAQPAPTGATAVDQNPIRRRGVGLRGLDAARACPGLTLFAPAAAPT